jgi:hypothetical protein
MLNILSDPKYNPLYHKQLRYLLESLQRKAKEFPLGAQNNIQQFMGIKFASKLVHLDLDFAERLYLDATSHPAWHEKSPARATRRYLPCSIL